MSLVMTNIELSINTGCLGWDLGLNCDISRDFPSYVFIRPNRNHIWYFALYVSYLIAPDNLQSQYICMVFSIIIHQEANKKYMKFLN